MARSGPAANRPGTITFTGNHMRLTFTVPVRGEHESTEEFRSRQKEFFSRLPRASTASQVLALAHEAFVRSGAKDEAAAELTLTALARVTGWSLEDRDLYAQFPFKTPLNWIVFKHRIGITRRSHRTRRKKSVLRERERNVNTIRTQVSRYKRGHQHFDQLFQSWYGSYLYELDWVEWFRSHESIRLEQFESHRRDPALADSFLLACEAATLARMYWYSGREAEALPLYELALAMWKTCGTTWPKPRFDVVACLQKEIESLSRLPPPTPS